MKINKCGNCGNTSLEVDSMCLDGETNIEWFIECECGNREISYDGERRCIEDWNAEN